MNRVFTPKCRPLTSLSKWTGTMTLLSRNTSSFVWNFPFQTSYLSYIPPKPSWYTPWNQPIAPEKLKIVLGEMIPFFWGKFGPIFRDFPRFGEFQGGVVTFKWRRKASCKHAASKVLRILGWSFAHQTKNNLSIQPNLHPTEFPHIKGLVGLILSRKRGRGNVVAKRPRDPANLQSLHLLVQVSDGITNLKKNKTKSITNPQNILQIFW